MPGRLDDAVEQFRAAAVFLPDSPEIHFNLANTLRDLGRPDEAVAAYRQALRLKPDYLKAHNNLGNVLRDQGKLSEAAEVHCEALAIQPQYCARALQPGRRHVELHDRRHGEHDFRVGAQRHRQRASHHVGQRFLRRQRFRDRLAANQRDRQLDRGVAVQRHAI